VYLDSAVSTHAHHTLELQYTQKGEKMSVQRLPTLRELKAMRRFFEKDRQSSDKETADFAVIALGTIDNWIKEIKDVKVKK
jgi:hypothetical protein